MVAEETVKERVAHYRTGPLRTAALGSAGMLLALVVLVIWASAAARVVAFAYVIVALTLWWATGGEQPWIWDPARRRLKGAEISALSRLYYSTLHLNRGLARGLFQFALVLVALALVVVFMTLLVAAFDLLIDGSVSFDAYVRFFRDTVGDWIRQAADGHAGTDHIP